MSVYFCQKFLWETNDKDINESVIGRWLTNLYFEDAIFSLVLYSKSFGIQFWLTKTLWKIFFFMNALNEGKTFKQPKILKFSLQAPFFICCEKNKWSLWRIENFTSFNMTNLFHSLNVPLFYFEYWITQHTQEIYVVIQGGDLMESSCIGLWRRISCSSRTSSRWSFCSLLVSHSSS